MRVHLLTVCDCGGTPAAASEATFLSHSAEALPFLITQNIHRVYETEFSVDKMNINIVLKIDVRYPSGNRLKSKTDLNRGMSNEQQGKIEMRSVVAKKNLSKNIGDIGKAKKTKNIQSASCYN